MRFFVTIYVLRNRNIEREKAYYLKNAIRLRDKARKWAKANRKRINEKRRARYYFLKSRGDLPPRRNTYTVKKKYKLEAIVHYGGVCYCCGESAIAFLSIEHINNNGKDHGTAKTRYKGEALYRYLVKNDFPTGISIACFNCNIGRQNNGGICPHKVTK